VFGECTHQEGGDSINRLFGDDNACQGREDLNRRGVGTLPAGKVGSTPDVGVWTVHALKGDGGRPNRVVGNLLHCGVGNLPNDWEGLYPPTGFM
jgi:hypothetical protein